MVHSVHFVLHCDLVLRYKNWYRVSAAIMSRISVKFNFDPQELYQLAKFFLTLRHICRACCHQKCMDQTQLASF